MKRPVLDSLLPSAARLAFPGWKGMPVVTKEQAVPYAQVLHLDRFGPGPWQVTVDGELLGAYDWFGIDPGFDELRVWLRPVDPEIDRQRLFTGGCPGTQRSGVGGRTWVSTGWPIGLKNPSNKWGWETTYDADCGGTVASGFHEYLRFTAEGEGDLNDIVRFLNEELRREHQGEKFSSPGGWGCALD